MINANPLLTLVLVTAASSIAILAVGVLRRPLRYTAGARAAYCLWLLVPLTAFSVLLPGLPRSIDVMSVFQGKVGTTVSAAVMKAVEMPTSSEYTGLVLTCWLLGVFLMVGMLVRRQRAFVRSLGPVTRGPAGIHRSRCIVAPIVVGAWPARIVVPKDFETRYSSEERLLMLAHERVHVARADAQINAIAAGWQCIFWFNPLVYLAVGQFRFDQELACDAVVLARTEIGRRRYGDALLKTQLASDTTCRVPLGCQWQSNHPLKARVAMLKRPAPTILRRVGGVGFCIILTMISSYTAWAIQSDLHGVGGSNSPLAISMKWSINDVDALTSGNPSSRDELVVNAGTEFVRRTALSPGNVYETRCVASLPNTGKPSPKWEIVKASGQSIAGLILLECRISNNERVFSTPSIAVRGGKRGSIEVSNKDGSVISRLELTASASIIPASH